MSLVDKIGELATRVGQEFVTVREELDAIASAGGVIVTASGDNFTAWSDGRIEQWGQALIANGDSGTQVVLPVACPTEIKSFIPVAAGDVEASFKVTVDSQGAVTVKHNANGGVEIFFYAVGH